MKRVLTPFAGYNQNNSAYSEPRFILVCFFLFCKLCKSTATLQWLFIWRMTFNIIMTTTIPAISMSSHIILFIPSHCIGIHSPLSHQRSISRFARSRPSHAQFGAHNERRTASSRCYGNRIKERPICVFFSGSRIVLHIYMLHFFVELIMIKQ